MSERNSGGGYEMYWWTWVCLLVLTVVMIFVDRLALPKSLLVFILVSTMLLKATLIAFNFMHLRFESVTLAVMVGVGILATGAALFFLILPDGIRVLEMSSGRGSL